MKKTLLLLMLCMTSALAIKAQDTDVSGIANVIYIEPFTVEPGTTEVDLPICMKNTAAIRGLQFDLYLPEGASIEMYEEEGDWYFEEEPEFNSSRLPKNDKHEILGAPQADGSIRFLISSSKAQTFTGEDGVLFTVTITLDANMAEGAYPITMKEIKLSETNGTQYPTEEVKTTMTISSATAINGISANKAVKGAYNIAGQQTNVQKGINIVDGKKVMIK